MPTPFEAAGSASRQDRQAIVPHEIHSEEHKRRFDLLKQQVERAGHGSSSSLPGAEPFLLQANSVSSSSTARECSGGPSCLGDGLSSGGVLNRGSAASALLNSHAHKLEVLQETVAGVSASVESLTKMCEEQSSRISAIERVQAQSSSSASPWHMSWEARQRHDRAEFESSTSQLRQQQLQLSSQVMQIQARLDMLAHATSEQLRTHATAAAHQRQPDMPPYAAPQWLAYAAAVPPASAPEMLQRQHPSVGGPSEPPARDWEANMERSLSTLSNSGDPPVGLPQSRWPSPHMTSAEAAAGAVPHPSASPYVANMNNLVLGSPVGHTYPQLTFGHPYAPVSRGYLGPHPPPHTKSSGQPAPPPFAGLQPSYDSAPPRAEPHKGGSSHSTATSDPGGTAYTNVSSQGLWGQRMADHRHRAPPAQSLPQQYGGMNAPHMQHAPASTTHAAVEMAAATASAVVANANDAAHAAFAHLHGAKPPRSGGEATAPPNGSPPDAPSSIAPIDERGGAQSDQSSSTYSSANTIPVMSPPAPASEGGANLDLLAQLSTDSQQIHKRAKHEAGGPFEPGRPRHDQLLGTPGSGELSSASADEPSMAAAAAHAAGVETGTLRRYARTGATWSGVHCANSAPSSAH